MKAVERWGRRLSFWLRFVIVLVAPMAGCGSSDSPTSTASPNGYACAQADPAAKTPSCLDCVTAKCDSDLNDAYGPNWASGNVDGICPSSFATCAKRCSCSDGACGNACLSAAGDACKSAVFLASSCIAALCGNLCE